jgi:hypothetical protein
MNEEHVEEPEKQVTNTNLATDTGQIDSIETIEPDMENKIAYREEIVK